MNDQAIEQTEPQSTTQIWRRCVYWDSASSIALECSEYEEQTKKKRKAEEKDAVCAPERKMVDPRREKMRRMEEGADVKDVLQGAAGARSEGGQCAIKEMAARTTFSYASRVPASPLHPLRLGVQAPNILQL